MPFVLVLLVAALVFHVWMLLDAIQRPDAQFNPPASKIWWIVGLAVTFFIGLGFVAALLYFFLVRKPAMEGRATPVAGTGLGRAIRPARGPRMRVCSTCGADIGTHALYCQRCGTPVRTEDG